VTGEPLGEPSPEFIDLIYDVLRKQQWFRDYQESTKADSLPFIGRYSLDADPDEIARDMATVLGLSEQTRREASTWEEFLRRFIRKAEAAGILVLRSGVVENNNRRKLSVEEFRGFAVSDDLAPLVFLNGQDAKAAQIFTLAHELAHLWVGESGISNPNYLTEPGQQPNNIDRLCDKVAAELLVPKADFLLRWDDRQSVPANLQTLATHYRVSRVTVLRRALETQRLSIEEFRQAYAELAEEQRPPRGGEGGNFFFTLLARNSSTLTATLIAAAAEGVVPERDAARLLNIKIRTVESVRKHLSEEGIPGA
jgi:Zn-dependent peptidase ImmA (M78 family)